MDETGNQPPILNRVNIHKISPADHSMLQDLIDSLGPFYSEEARQQMKESLAHLDGYTAISGTDCLGFVLYSIEQGFQKIGIIQWLGVPMAALSHSAASMLLSRLMRELRKKLIGKIRVSLPLAPPGAVNQVDLLSFYRDAGFQPSSENNNILEKRLF